MPKCSKCGKEFPYEKMFCPLGNRRADYRCSIHLFDCPLMCEKCAEEHMNTSKYFGILLPVTVWEEHFKKINILFSEHFVKILRNAIDERIEGL